MIVKWVVKQAFTEPFKTKGNQRNVHLKVLENGKCCQTVMNENELE